MIQLSRNFGFYFNLLFAFSSLCAYSTNYDDLVSKNLIQEGDKPSLHLGCGEHHIDGYINIDFPIENRTLHKNQAADYFFDISKLSFPQNSIHAIENHHVFEHFSRATSLALLCAWHYFLEESGALVIETPDFARGIKRYSKTHSFKTKQAIIRHLFGSQEAPWALHWDGWSEDKFRHILSKLGFSIISVNCFSWECLDNILVTAKKGANKNIIELKEIGKELLKLSMVNTTDSEIEMWKGWCTDFEQALDQMIPTTLSLKQIIPKNVLIYDVGAHIGTKTKEFLKFEPTLVLAIEPQPACIQRLNREFINNPSVQIIPFCLSEQPGTLELSICSEAPTISTCSSDWKKGRFSNYTWDKKEIVKAITLDQLIETYGAPYYCKIDVEGFEYSVLKGLSMPLPLISIEYTREFFEETKKSIMYLNQLGMGDFNFTIGENPSFYFDSFVDADTLINAIQNLSDSLLWGDIYAKTNPIFATTFDDADRIY
jgi:FkbM family methyltransferase